MATFAVFEPPLKKQSAANVDVLARAERFKFVRDGFSWLAFIFGPVWMLCNRLWLAFVCYCVAIFAITAAAMWFGLAEGAVTLASLVLALLVGFEATTLRRRKLMFWRWQDAGIVVERNREAAERRFFDRWVVSAPTQIADTPAANMPAASNLVVMPTVAAPTPSATPQAPAEPVQRVPIYDPESYVIGMFPPKGTPPGGKP
jgi:hypothetical protein